MSLTIDQRRERIRSRVGELRFWIDGKSFDLDDWHVSGVPVALGQPWPSRDGVVTLLHGEVHIPESLGIGSARLELDLGGEGLVCICYPDGEEEPFGLDAFHKLFPLKGRTFALQVEAVARFPFGRPNRDPRLERARVVEIETGLDRLVRQLTLIVQTARVLGTHDAVVPLVEAAERAVQSVELPSRTPDYVARVASSRQMQSIWQLPEMGHAAAGGLSRGQRASIEAASEGLARDLRTIRDRYPPDGLIGLSGHAHIDLAWLWPMDETRRKARRTFSTVLALMDRNPELKFNQSSAQLYAFVEHDDPVLFKRIKERVERGQWEPVGGMWVEPDTNMPAGESLVRQLLYGQRYFQRHFGKIHTVCWLPDCFGFTPALPQLLRGAGIENFFTIKLTWSETNPFPYDLFWWEGLDGSRVLAHLFNNPASEDTDTEGYNADPGPAALLDTWRNYKGRHRYSESLLSIGYGDGGGGVTMEMLDRARELKNFPALPATHFTTVAGFYDRARAAVAGSELPSWSGELYLELHRGTLTSQGKTKYLHRRAERDLVAAETLGSLNHLLGGPAPHSLEAEWQVLLRNQFHDILPGSSIREVYETAERELSDVVSMARTTIQESLHALAGRLLHSGDSPALFVVNPDLHPRPLRLEMQEMVPGAQPVDGGSVIATAGIVPGLGTRSIVRWEPATSVAVSSRHLENGFVRVELAEDGTVTRLYDKRAAREALSAPGNLVCAYVDKPAAWDAWDVDAGYPREGEPVAAAGPLTVVEDGPHRAAIRVVRRFRSSTITQDVRLWANSPRLEFKTTIEWHDRRWLVKARFPVAVHSQTASFETAFGIVQRPTHRNTTWDSARFEVAAHRFVDISEPRYGVALLNDGKYGHHALGNELGISLLRSPSYPDPLADEGTQTFTYALLPHEGGLHESEVLMEAEDLNRPLLATAVQADGDTVRHDIRVEGLPLGLGTLKALEDGDGLVLRVYEPHGARGHVELTLPEHWSCDAELDLLENVVAEPGRDFLPFQVRSWRLRPHR